jgi:hypothetical protein
MIKTEMQIPKAVSGHEVSITTFSDRVSRCNMFYF